MKNQNHPALPPHHVETSESIDSLETHAPDSTSSEPKSPVSSLSSAMDVFLVKPKLTRKTQRKPKQSYNSQAVCITEDDFVKKLKEGKDKKERSGADHQKKAKKGANKSSVGKGSRTWQDQRTRKGSRVQQDSRKQRTWQSSRIQQGPKTWQGSRSGPVTQPDPREQQGLRTRQGSRTQRTQHGPKTWHGQKHGKDQEQGKTQ